VATEFSYPSDGGGRARQPPLDTAVRGPHHAAPCATGPYCFLAFNPSRRRVGIVVLTRMRARPSLRCRKAFTSAPMMEGACSASWIDAAAHCIGVQNRERRGSASCRRSHGEKKVCLFSLSLQSQKGSGKMSTSRANTNSLCPSLRSQTHEKERPNDVPTNSPPALPPIDKATSGKQARRDLCLVALFERCQSFFHFAGVGSHCRYLHTWLL